MPAPDQNGSQPSKNGHAHEPQPNGERPTFEDLINEAVALRNVLADAAQRSARLATALKQQRRHGRVLRNAIDSLRELKLGP